MHGPETDADILIELETVRSCYFDARPGTIVRIDV